MEADAGRIYPLCVAEVDVGTLPEPLSRLQALSLGKADHIRQFFQALTDQFGFGNMKGFKGSVLKAKIPGYPSLKVAETDIRSGTLYNGPYEGYSDDELREVVDEEFFGPAWKTFRYMKGYGETIFNQKLIHYRDVDDELLLPPGTAKRLLISQAATWQAIPVVSYENSLRLGYQHEETTDK
jgi:hypothetical protein